MNWLKDWFNLKFKNVVLHRHNQRLREENKRLREENKRYELQSEAFEIENFNIGNVNLKQKGEIENLRRAIHLDNIHKGKARAKTREQDAAKFGLPTHRDSDDK